MPMIELLMKKVFENKVGFLISWIIVFFSIAFSASSKAQLEQQFIHIVSEGETLASIAQRYYGDPKKEQVLVSENSLTELGGSAIIVGMRLTIPFVYFHRVKEGETWQDLAHKYYGDRRKAFLLINENRGSIKEKPPVGGELKIPYPLRHVASQNETLTKVASTYFETKKKASLLRRFNKRRSNRLDRGQIVLVPLSNLLLSKQGKEIVEKGTQKSLSSGEVLALQKNIDARLPTLKKLVKEGEYLGAVALGNYLLGAKNLTGNQLVTIQKEIAVAYIAMDNKKLAIEAFMQALKYQPFLELDLVRTSPKVFELFNEAKQNRALNPDPIETSPD